MLLLKMAVAPTWMWQWQLHLPSLPDKGWILENPDRGPTKGCDGLSGPDLCSTQTDDCPNQNCGRPTRLSEPEYPLNCPEPKFPLNLPDPEEPEFYSTGPGLEEEPVQSLKEATRALNLIDPVLKKRLFNHAAGMEIKVVTGFNSSCQGEDDAEDRHWWIQKPWKHRRIEISNKYITISNLKGIEADSKVLETLAHTKGLDK